MKAVRLFSLVAIFASCFASPQVLRAADTFSSIGEGIKFAQENKRLIVFVLGRGFSDDTKTVQNIISEELVLHGKEFAVVHCDQGNAANRSLFTDKFKQDISELPLVVVTDAQGNLIQAEKGTERDAYETMIQVARIKTGLEKDPKKIAAGGVKEEDMGFIGDGGVFGLRKKDVASMKIALTNMRKWLFKNEAVLEAELLEAKGSIGVFRKPDGNTIEVDFNTLSDNDIAYIQQSVAGGQGIGK